MKEVFIDEKEKGPSDSSSWGGNFGGGGGVSGGGGSSGAGGGGSSGGGSWGDGGESSGSSGGTWGGGDRTPEYLRLTTGGCLMMDETGELLFCHQSCEEMPMLTISLQRDSNVEEKIEDRHARCIQCNLVYTQLTPLLTEPEKTLYYDLWPTDASAPGVHYAGNFPLPEPGEVLTVKLMWQKGHHNINELAKMKTVICGVDCGTKTISRQNWKSVAVIKMDDNGRFTVNGLYGKLRN